MPAITWPEDPQVFERGIAVLLSRMHSDIQRIDGAGGDGGRDAQFQDSQGLHVFEMKSFTGRMTPPRKAQVMASLQRAAELDPASWTLIVPIDPTPRELTWFEALRDGFPFVLPWRGASWIEARLTEHPQVRRYYFADAMSETNELLRQLLQEQGPITDVNAALQRIQSVAARLSKLEPHYAFTLSAGPGADCAVEVGPAYPGAERDRPAGIWLAFTDTAEGQAAAREWERAIAFGDPIEVPGEHLADLRVQGPAILPFTEGGPPKPGTWLRVAARTIPADEPVQILIADETGQRRAILGVQMTSARAGTRGSVLSGTDSTGSLQCTLRMDHIKGTLRMEIELAVAEELRPADRLEVVRFAAALQPGNTTQILIRGQPLTEAQPVPMLEGIDREAAQDMIELLEQLITIEHLAVVTFALPNPISASDKAAIRATHALLTGHRVEIEGSVTSLTAHDTPQIREAASGLIEVSGILQEDHHLDVLGQSIPVGTVRVDTPPLRVTSVVPAPDGDLVLSLEPAPGSSDVPRVRLTPAPPRP